MKTLSHFTRGQGAMEYLMTYGWGILVILVVGVVMWQLGIFEGTGGAVTFTGFARIKPMASVTEMRSTGVFTGTFENLNGAKMTINSLTIRNRFDSVDCATVTATPTEVPNSEFFKVDASGCTGASHIAGQDYMLDFTIDYDMTVVGIQGTHRESGTLKGQYE